MRGSAEQITNDSDDTLYFAYGSNLWLQQMRRRCPDSSFMGVAILFDWAWQINTRQYANIVQSKDDIVYGMIYRLSADDEATLDKYEGVPDSYEKKWMKMDYLPEEGEATTIHGLVYVNLKLKDVGQAKEEYVGRMNRGINDALASGVPKWYIEKYLRPFIPGDSTA